MDINQQGPASHEEYEAARMAAKFAMTNAELADAIAATFQRCDVRYIGGTNASDTETGVATIAHLKELLAIQRARAAILKVGAGETAHNASVSGARSASDSTRKLD